MDAKDFDNFDKNDFGMGEHYGGEVREVVKKTISKKFKCDACGWEGIIDVKDIRGYKDSNGYKDSRRRVWWIYWRCPNQKCNNELTIDKVWLKMEDLS